MKKVTFLCCLFCGLITQAVGATNNCKPQKIDSHASKESGKYLFVDESNYDNELALVCGGKGTDGCEHGTMVMAHSNHYYKDVEIDQDRLYRCDTSGGSSWELVLISGLDECSGEPEKGRFKFRNLENDDFYVLGSFAAGSGYWFLQDLCKVAKKGSDSNDDPSPATSEEKKAATEKTEQGTGQTQSGDGTSGQGTSSSGTSAKNRSGDAEKDSEKKPGQGAGQNQSGDAGKKSETTSAQGTSSSDTSGTDVSGTGATGTGTSGAGTSAQTKSGDAGKKSETTSAQGASSSATSGTGTSTQTKSGDAEKKSEKKPEQGASSSDASGTGATGADATGTATSGTDISGTGTTGTGATGADATGAGTSGAGTSTQKQSIDTGTSLTQSQTSRVRALTQKIESAASQLDSMSSKFKVSGWKDAEGKFNTARLASDSIAGVVLGTAGGLITSHVVKKNQVENGFQDIKCTIGGQSVANWGDEFSVGIQ